MFKFRFNPLGKGVFWYTPAVENNKIEDKLNDTNNKVAKITIKGNSFAAEYGDKYINKRTGVVIHKNDKKYYMLNKLSNGQYVFTDTSKMSEDLPTSYQKVTTLDNSWDEDSHDDYEGFVWEEGISAIADNAFSGCEELTTVDIPETVETIGDSAFSDCTNLNSVTVNSVTPPTMGENVFTNCENLDVVKVPVSATTNYSSATGWSDYSSSIMATSADNKLVLSDNKYLMSVIYPNTYQTMTSVPDELDTTALTKAYSMFYNCYALEEVPVLDLSTITNTSMMFRYCKKLKTIPAGKLNVKANTNLNLFFQHCEALEMVDDSVFTDCQPTTVYSMFYNCPKLVQVPYIDLSKCTDVSEMFAFCESLPETFPYVIDLSSVDWSYGDIQKSSISNTTYYAMFANTPVKTIKVCGLKKNSLDETAIKILGANITSGVNGGTVTYEYRETPLNIVYCDAEGNELPDPLVLSASKYKMSDIYEDYQTKTVLSEELNTTELTSMDDMFNGCAALTELPNILDFLNCTSAQGMFDGCSALTKVYVKNISDTVLTYLQTTYPQNNISEVKETITMTRSARTMADIYPTTYTTMTKLFNIIDTSELDDASSLFKDCSNLTSTQDELETTEVENMSYMFYGCANLTTVPEFTTISATNMSYMFAGCSKLTEVPRLNMVVCTNVDNMFDGCLALTAVKVMNISDTLLSALQTAYPTITFTVVKEPKVLTNSAYKMSVIYPSTYTTMTEVPDELDVSALTKMLMMFYGCEKLVIAPTMDTKNITNMGTMFLGCVSLTTVPEMNTAKVTTFANMFNSCSALTAIDWAIDFSSATNINGMFSGCSALKSVKVKNISDTLLNTLKSTYTAITFTVI